MKIILFLWAIMPILYGNHEALLIDDPENPLHLYNAGVSCVQGKNYTQAINYFELGQSHKNCLSEQEYFWLSYNLANCYALEDKKQQALDLFEQLFAKYPDDNRIKDKIEYLKNKEREEQHSSQQKAQQEKQQDKEQQAEQETPKQHDKQERQEQTQEEKAGHNSETQLQNSQEKQASQDQDNDKKTQQAEHEKSEEHEINSNSKHERYPEEALVEALESVDRSYAHYVMKNKLQQLKGATCDKAW